jgi:hypothetical protein
VSEEELKEVEERRRLVLHYAALAETKETRGSVAPYELFELDFTASQGTYYRDMHIAISSCLPVFELLQFIYVTM